MNNLQSSRTVPQIFSSTRRDLAVKRAQRLRQSSEAADWLGLDFADEVIERLGFMRFTPPRARVCGVNGDIIASDLEPRGIDVSFVASPRHDGPIEDGPFDLIATCGSLETVNDLPGALIHIRNALSDGGLFIGQILGAGSVPNLRKIMLEADGDRPAARIHPQIDTRAATGLLERAGFSRQVVDSHSLTVRFSNFDRLIGDLREQALTSVLLSQAPHVGKAGLARARQAFDQLRDEDGKVTETFEVLTLTGWR